MTTKQSKPQAKGQSEGAQSKIQDSESWIVHLRHFTMQNSIDSFNKKKVDPNIQIQYVIAATFDGWLSIKIINVFQVKWVKVYGMKMSMPVVNSFIQFNDKFQPKSLILAYFDGSIDYSPWEKIQNNFAIEISASKRREIKKQFPDILKQTCRGGYVNKINDEQPSIEQAMMLETVCFLHKQGQFIYVMNFKGELKIFVVKDDNNSRMRLVSKIDLPSKIIKAECMRGLNDLKQDNLTVIVCYLDIPIPIILELSPNIVQTEIQKRTEFIFQKHLNAELHYQNNTSIKLLTYDPSTKLIITCNQNNQIELYSFEKQKYSLKDFVLMSNIQRCFSINYKDNTDIINDLSTNQSKLAIICQHSFSIYDLKQQIMLISREKLKQEIQIGKLVTPCSSIKQKPLFLIKKKFNYFAAQTKKSTTLHLFIGK